MVPPSSLRVSRVRSYSGYSCLSLVFAYKIITFFDSTSHSIRLTIVSTFAVLNPVFVSKGGLASSGFARHYSRNLFDFSSSAYLDVSVRQVPLLALCVHASIPHSSHGGFPHSEIHGSKLTYSSPWLIAVNHVLLRLLMPRHSPYALVHLNYCPVLIAVSLAISVSFYWLLCHPIVTKLQFFLPLFFLERPIFLLL